MSAINQKPVIVLGGGISGLATAWFLHKAGISFKLFEKEARTGGKIETNFYEETVLEFGPNSIRDKNGAIRELAKELSLSQEIIEISETFKTRFIVRDGKLCEVSPTIGSFLTTDVLSLTGKLRAFLEPLKTKGTTEDESVGEFLERRFGKEAVDYLVDPIFSGIYAGDIYRMSKKTVLAGLAGLEQDFGSISWGAIRSKKEKKIGKPVVISFKKGIQQLTDELTKRLSKYIIYEEVTSLEPKGNGFKISSDGNDMEASQTISCISAYQLARIMKGFDPKTSTALSDIDYSPMLSTQVIYDRKIAARHKAGFGFLIPRKENYRLLGSIWKSEIFPAFCSPGKTHFTLMTGGAHDRNILIDPVKEVEKEILEEFSELMEISEKPEYVNSKLWEEAIPQFEIGYALINQKIAEAEQQNPGLHIGGNYRWGISVPDCVQGARKCVGMLEK
ncbi:MAG: protoporphyrinogen oxidase [Balneolaceae bacterium]